MKSAVVTREYDLSGLSYEHGQYKSARFTKPAHTTMQALQQHLSLSDADWDDFLNLFSNTTTHLYSVLIPGLTGKESIAFYVRDADSIVLLHFDADGIMRTHNIYAARVFEIDENGGAAIFGDEMLTLLDELRDQGRYYAGRALKLYLAELEEHEPGEWIELLEYATAAFG